MIKIPELDQRPLVVAIAGSNGSGKTTFYYSHIRQAALRYISADVLAHEMNWDAYVAANAAHLLRRQMVSQRESFAFETVFSDPAGDKVKFLKETADSGYRVVLCFIGLTHAGLSEERVAMRVSQGGHDVPDEKIQSRFPRILANLDIAIRVLPLVYIFDNSDLNRPFRKVAIVKNGVITERSKRIPKWFILP